MDTIRAWGFIFGLMLCGVIAMGYIPFLIDQNDMILGLFRRTWYADGLHAVSALWAFIAAATSRRAALLFFQLFGPVYFLDGVVGVLAGASYLDFGVFITGPLDLPLSTRIFANLPHLFLGGLASFVGYVLGRRRSSAIGAPA
jgi:hypothetical protein